MYKSSLIKAEFVSTYNTNIPTNADMQVLVTIVKRNQTGTFSLLTKAYYGFM